MRVAKINRAKKFPALLIILSLVCIGLAACSSKDDSWERVREASILRVGLDPTFPPFENADTAELHGLDVDLARAIGDELGLEVEFAYFGYDGLYDALATEQVDVLLSALVIDITKTRDFAYSEPYFNAGQILIASKDNREIESMDSLGGRAVAVELGSEGHIQALEWEKRVPNLTILPRNSAAEALTAVQEGEADAALIDQVSGRLFLSSTPSLVIRDTAVSVEPYALVVRQADRALLERLNDALEAITVSGQLDAITQKWLDTP